MVVRQVEDEGPEEEVNWAVVQIACLAADYVLQRQGIGVRRRGQNWKRY